VSSNSGRFDVVRVLLAAGADPAPLQWTPLMRAIALGSHDEVAREIEAGADLSAKDFWSRTPWLLSLQVGDIPKAKLLLRAGACRIDRGRCGKPPLMYPIFNEHLDMLRWLLSEGLNPNEPNDFGQTPLWEAVEAGSIACATILLDAGADIHHQYNSTPVLRSTDSLAMIRLLVDRGAELNDISDEMRASLTRLPFNRRIRVTSDEYLAYKSRRFAVSNLEQMDHPFWKSMIESGADAYEARKKFNDLNSETPIWCFRRFGKSINELPDGRIIEIGGEHEDYYDPDFCIYNDVVVHNLGGTFDIYGYPKDCFPPTDFHSATLVGHHIYLIGRLGYQGERIFGETPIYRLRTEDYVMEKLTSFGQTPGWISAHKAVYLADHKIRISGGKISSLAHGKELYEDNTDVYLLDLNTLQWSREMAVKE
jgi:hypothetical protein